MNDATQFFDTTAPTGYNVERSLRFNSSDSAFLSRTPASAGNRRTWTFSCWVKRSLLGSSFQTIFGAGTGGNAEASIRFNSDDTLEFYAWTGVYNARLLTTQVFRDVSAWYHLVAVFDTPNATADQRIRLYINGIEITTFSSRTNPTQNYDGYFNNSISHTIGDAVSGASPRFFNGYLAECILVDGQALTPSSFAKTNATTGQWVPKAYTGTYGTNGFQLKFADNSNNTATTLGKDYSSNGNNWTPNNLSVTAGAGNDSLVDTPTSYGTDDGLGGSVRGNYATLNPLANGGLTLSNGNLDSSRATTSWKNARATIGVSTGKWYWEYTATSSYNSTNTPKIGIALNNASFDDPGASDALSWAYMAFDGTKWSNASPSGSAYGATWTNGDVIGVAFDADAGSLTYYKNGVSQGAAFTGLPANTYFPLVGYYGTASGVYNFGQRPFAYPVSGYKALCDTNLPAPVVAKPSTVMDVIAYSGSGASRTFTDLSYSPDLVWIKHRSGANNHRLYDVVRGTTKALYSNLTNSEGTDSTGLTAFTSNGFTLGDGDVVWNASGQTYVAWTWDAGSSTVTNTQGSITSQVRANASAGFSIVTWSTPVAAGTIGHGLNATPSLIITKDRGTNTSWFVYHASLGSGKYLELQTTNAQQTNATVYSTSPTSTTFSPGTGFIQLSGYSSTMVSYCFAPVAGYSSFGVVTATGTSDGGFAYTGFRPRFLLYKNASGTGNWGIYDSARDPENVCDNLLLPSASNAEFTSVEFDFLSNGIKLRYPYTNGHQIVFAAFAEAPFQYARAR